MDESRSVDPLDIAITTGADPRVARLVAAYGAELIGRAPWIETQVSGWDVSTEEFLVASRWGAEIACAALRQLDDSTVELRRMFVVPAARGTGTGRALLDAAEARAAAHGYARMVLDTMSVLTEAVSLYRSSGYVAIPSYNDNPAADLWFEKRLPT